MKFLYQLAQDGRLDINQVKVPNVDANIALQNILNTVYYWAGIVCVIIIVVAGFLYVMSAGDSATVQKAKNAITGAVIGLVVILLAYTITAFVLGRIG